MKLHAGSRRVSKLVDLVETTDLMIQIMRSKKILAKSKPLAEIPGEATRRRIMDAAEQLFAARGFGDVSLREIVVKAGVNVASVNYHFGSKEELIKQVFARRATPVLAQTELLLREAENFADRPDYLERIITAIITPSIRGRSNSSEDVRTFNRLRGFLFIEKRGFADVILNSPFYAEPALRLLEVFRRALPGMPPNELAWKLHILFGALQGTTTEVGRIHPVLSASYRPDDPQEALSYLVPLLVALLRAPWPSPHAPASFDYASRNG